MANKITQLVNKAGDNLYPLAGGIMSDSVTTDMLQDGAVTSDKIDSTTYPAFQANGGADLQVAANSLIPYPNISTNIGGFTVEDNNIIVPKSGKYLVSASATGRFDANKGWIQLVVYRGNATTATYSIGGLNRDGAGGYRTVDVPPAVVQLVQNDKVRVVAREDIADLNNGGTSNATQITIAMIP